MIILPHQHTALLHWRMNHTSLECCGVPDHDSCYASKNIWVGPACVTGPQWETIIWRHWACQSCQPTGLLTFSEPTSSYVWCPHTHKTQNMPHYKAINLTSLFCTIVFSFCIFHQHLIKSFYFRYVYCFIHSFQFITTFSPPASWLQRMKII